MSQNVTFTSLPPALPRPENGLPDYWAIPIWVYSMSKNIYALSLDEACCISLADVSLAFDMTALIWHKVLSLTCWFQIKMSTFFKLKMKGKK